MGKRGLTAKISNCFGGLGMMQFGFEGDTLEEANGTINYLENTRLKDSGFFLFSSPPPPKQQGQNLSA